MEKRDAVKSLQDCHAGLLPKDRHDKYRSMAISPFIFYRGSNHLFWRDFVTDSRLQLFGNTKTRTWLQGDMHAENMGAYKNDQGQVVYGINDFDDAVIADYQFDVWRLAVSLVLVAQQNKIPREQQDTIVAAFANAYLKTMTGYTGNTTATQTYFTDETTNTCQTLKQFLQEVAKKKNRKKMLEKWTESSGKDSFFALTPEMNPPVRVSQKLAPISESERTAILGAMPGYQKTLEGDLKDKPDYFRVEDIAQRLLAGTGSTGTPRYYILIEGKSAASRNDRILDVKLQSTPTAYTYFNTAAQNEFDACFPNPSERHALAYRSLTTVQGDSDQQISADPHLGWMTFFDSVYSVRERSPQKATFPIETLTSVSGFVEMAEQWATILFTAHARAHENFNQQAVLYPLADQIAAVTTGREDAFQKLVNDIAFSYAAQVEKDWEAFTAVLKSKDGPPAE